MNQLSGRLVVIVLSVKEGRGFQQSQNSFYLEANLNGRNIVSDPVAADSEPLFCTELVWEIEKKQIRKLRASHVPIRLECFSLDDDRIREKIGFNLLHLRSARPIPGDHPVEIDYKWYKLLGVHSDHKPHHPELSLSLTIRDKLRDGINTAIQEVPNTSASDNITEPCTPTDLLQNPDEQIEFPLQNLSVLYVDNGFIQIGDAQEPHELYSLSFLLETAFNLDLLKPPTTPFDHAAQCYITLRYFDLEVSTKKFNCDFNEPVIMNEKFIFKLSSTLNYLKTYFEQNRVCVLKLYQGSKVLADTELNLTNFQVDNNNGGGSKRKFEQDCMFRLVKVKKIPEGSNGRKPFVSTETSLEKSTEKGGSKSIYDDNKACGDQDNNSNNKPQEVLTPLTDFRSNNSKPMTSAKSIFTTFKEGPITYKSNMTTSDEETYKLYCLTTAFTSIIWKHDDNFKDGFQFRFCHPKSNTVLVVQCNADDIVTNEIIALENVVCKQYFMSTAYRIATLIYNNPPTVMICNAQNMNITENFELYTKLFLAKKVDMLQGKDASCSYFAMIASVKDEDDIICEIQVDMHLKDHGFDPKDYDKTCYDLEPIILDDNLAFKTLAELEKWKRDRQDWFNQRQKYIENENLKLLKAEWERKRVDLETKLSAGIEKCRILSEELISATNELELKRQKLESQTSYVDNPEDIEIQVTKMLEEEMNMKIERIKQDNNRLLQRIVNLEADNNKLNQQILSKDMEMEEMKRSALTKEQTTSLLQELRNLEEKYRQEQNAKGFYKEQWQKTVKEVHELKSEDQKHIQMQIRRKKNELSQLSLDTFEDEEESESDSSESLLSCNNSVNTAALQC